MSMIPPAGRLLLLPLLVLAACAAPPDLGTPPEADAPAATHGLDADELAALRGLGFPVLIPDDVGDFVLDGFEAETDGAYGSYTLDYRRADGACFELTGTNEGLGGPDWPLVSAPVRIASVGLATRVYEAADDPGATSAQVWGLGTVVSDIIMLDGTGILFISDTDGGCRPLPFEEGVALVGGLQPLPVGPARPPSTGGDLGVFAPAEDLMDTMNAGSSPSVAAEALADRLDAAEVQVEILSETSYEAVALVTALRLRDDSVRDERLRLTYAPYGDTWELVAAGRQVRCQPRRGVQDWHDGLCR